jgi:hypothetical protein
LKGLSNERADLFGDPHRPGPAVGALMRYRTLAEDIEAFWLEDANRESGAWKEHRDINMVMLATSLAPDGFLTL